MHDRLQRFLTLLGSLTLAASAHAAPQDEHGAESQDRPLRNVVFVLADDLGWTDLGSFGSTFYDTPHLDALAASGARLTQAYAACPVCSPTRSSILTGQYPARTHNTDYFGAPQPEALEQRERYKRPLLPPRYEPRLAADALTLAEALKEAGFATFFAGKWHLGHEGSYPEDHGFDVNKGGHERGGPYGGKKYFSPYGNPRLEDGPDGEHLPARLGRETADFIRANKDGRFLAYLSFYSVHTPLMGREDLVAKYEARRAALEIDGEIWGQEPPRKVRLVQEHAVYGAMVEAMDAAVGEVLRTLEEEGLADDTLVVFFSDNGGLSTSEGHPTSNVPLRAGKGWLYEGGVREPTLVRWPGRTAPGSTVEAPVISTDFYPTILEALGLPARPDQHVDGRSFAEILDGGAGDATRPMFWHYPHYGNQGGTPGGAVRLGDWKLIEFYEDGRLELYDLARDLSETTNRVEEEPERAATMRALLDGWRRGTGARMPRPNPRAAQPGTGR